MFIYVITNNVTGKVYIGQHKGNNLKKYLQTKFSQSRYELKRKGHGRGSRLFSSMRKHPKEVWSIDPIFSDIQTKEELNRLERMIIALYDTCNPEIGYNICKGGEGYTGPFTQAMKEAWCNGNKRYWDRLGLVGQTFNRLTVMSEVSTRSGGGKKLWNCQCSCGNTSQVRTSALKSGGIRSCGCLISEAATKRVGGVDLVGMVFGRLVVESDAGRCKWSQKLWKCKCDCGNYTVARTAALKGNRTRNCGCIAKSKAQS